MYFQSYTILWLVFTCAISGTDGQLYSEQYRLQYHFSPEINWMNDPCGLIYYEGDYHLFYQYNPYGNLWGNMHWAHAISSDLVHWEHLPIAIPEENGTMIFTGSSVYDVNNTSGFGSAENAPIVAMYTGMTPSLGSRQDQRLAYSLDSAMTWTKFSGNPVLDIGSSEFRDPSVFWYEPASEWRMVITLSVDHVIRIYGSPNLRDWTPLSDFSEGEPGRIWECPNLYQLPVDGDEENMKWVMIVSVNGFEAIPTQDFGIQYFIGEFNGTHFINDNPPDTRLWVEQAKDYYAPHAWSNIPPQDGRRVWIGWFNYPEYAGVMPVFPWRGSQSIPRELKLKTTPSGVRLCQEPISELQLLRSGQNWSYSGLTIPELQDSITTDNLHGNQLELALTLTPTLTTGHFGIEVLQDDTYKTVIGSNLTDSLYTVYADTTQAGEIFSERFPDVYTMNVDPNPGDTMDIRIFVDWSSVEVFAASGSAVFSLRVFPPSNPDGVRVFGANVLVDLDAYQLSSIWT